MGNYYWEIYDSKGVLRRVHDRYVQTFLNYIHDITGGHKICGATVKGVFGGISDRVIKTLQQENIIPILPQFEILDDEGQGVTVFPAELLYQLSGGPENIAGRIHRFCDDEACIAPDHHYISKPIVDYPINLPEPSPSAPKILIFVGDGKRIINPRIKLVNNDSELEINYDIIPS